MDNPDPIAALRKQLAEAEQRYTELCQQGTSSSQELAALEREIADYKAAIASASQGSSATRTHAMEVDAPTGIAVSGDVHAPIDQQSGGNRYEAGSQHFGDNVQGDKYVYQTLERRIEIDAEVAKQRLAEMPTDRVLERDIEGLPAWSRTPPLQQSHWYGRNW